MQRTQARAYGRTARKSHDAERGSAVPERLGCTGDVGWPIQNPPARLIIGEADPGTFQSDQTNPGGRRFVGDQPRFNPRARRAVEVKDERTARIAVFGVTDSPSARQPDPPWAYCGIGAANAHRQRPVVGRSVSPATNA